jgi:hypothetical protein
MNRKHFLSMLLLALGVCAAASSVAQSVVVYKHVDESGRVTYSNQPMKGAMVVELSPLTVLPKSQAASMVAASPAKVSAVTALAPQAPAAPSEVSNAAAAIDARSPLTAAQNDATPEPRAADTAQEPRSLPNVATLSATQAAAPAAAVITMRPPQRENLNAANAINARPAINSSMTAAMLAQQRREDVRRRILEGEIEAETQFMAEALADLHREQAKSVAMRSLRASILADERALAGKRPLSDDAVATKTVVERHFERVRELQDQVAMHEENLSELKNQLRSPPQRTALKSVQLEPTATAARLDASKLR